MKQKLGYLALLILGTLLSGPSIAMLFDIAPFSMDAFELPYKVVRAVGVLAALATIEGIIAISLSLRLQKAWLVALLHYLFWVAVTFVPFFFWSRL